MKVTFETTNILIYNVYKHSGTKVLRNLITIEITNLQEQLHLNLHQHAFKFATKLLGISTPKNYHQLYNVQESILIWVYRFVRVLGPIHTQRLRLLLRLRWNL